MTSGFSADSSQLPAGFLLSDLADQICRLGELGTKEETVDLDRLMPGESLT
uniref:Uncharacterized protein n=1 Tax=Setaria italica TaxID=4555 RepID=K4A2N4_SETIT